MREKITKTRQKLMIGLMVVFGLITGGQTLGQTSNSTGFENGLIGSWVFGGGTADANNLVQINTNLAFVRTGSRSIYVATNSTSTRYAENTSFTVATDATNVYIHAISWILAGTGTTMTANTAVAKSGGSSNGTLVAINTSSWIRSTIAWSSASSTPYPRLRKSALAGNAYFDDVVIYTSSSGTTDILSPNAPTSVSGSSSGGNALLTWTSGGDNTATGTTGVQATIVLKYTGSGTPTAPTLNNQATYAVNDIPATDWKVIKIDGAASGSSVNVEAISASTTYALYHRDLAYNYSSATNVTVTYSGGTAPTITTGTVGTPTTSGVSVTGNSITAIGTANVTADGIAWATTSGGEATGSNSVNNTGLDISLVPTNFNASASSLTANTKYYIKAFATNSVGTSWGAESNFTTLPGAPTSGTATSVSSTGFTANWTSAGIGGTEAYTYTFQYGTDINFTSPLPTETASITPGTPKTKVITGLVPGTTYYYRVKAVNTATGLSSDWSGTQNVTTSTAALAVPDVSSGAATVTNGGFTARWADVANEASYTLTVYDALDAVVGTPISNIGANSTSQAVTGLTNNTTYYYKVTAVGDGTHYTNTTSLASPTVRTKSTACSMTAFAITNQLSSSISGTDVTVNVSASADVTKLTTSTITISANASVSPALGVETDFTNPVNYTVTAEDGTTQTIYAVTVNKSSSIKLDVPAVTAGPTTATNQGFTAQWGTVAHTSSYTIKVYDATPAEVTAARKIGETGTSVVISGLSTNASYTYTVTAIGNGSDYTDSDPSASSSSIRTLNSAKAITSFVVAGVTATITEGTHTITGTLPAGNDITNLTPTVSVSAHGDYSPKTAQDFSANKTFTVTAEDTGTQDYTITLALTLAAPSVTAGPTSATNQGFTAQWGTVTYASSYDVAVYQAGSLVTGLTGVTGVTGTSLVITGLTNNVSYTYKVTANGDGTKYLNSVQSSASTSIRTLSTASSISAFSLAGQNSSSINGTAISVVMPYGAGVTSLTTSITASTGASVNPASGSTPDFTNPVHFIVTAEDGSTQTDYTVTVTHAAPSTAKAISVFTIGGVTATINETNHTISATLPAGTNRYSLAPTVITISALAGVSPAVNVAQDFRTSKTYTVTAQDGSTQDYTVSVTNAACLPTSDYFSSGLSATSPYTFTSTDKVYASSTGTTTYTATSFASISTAAPLCGSAGARAQHSFVVLQLVSSGATQIVVSGVSSGTSSTRTVTSVATSSSLTGPYVAITPGSIVSTISGSANCGTVTVSGLNIGIGTYVLLTFDGNIKLSGFEITKPCSSQLTAPSGSVTTDTRTTDGFTAHWSDGSNEIGYTVNVYKKSDNSLAKSVSEAANTTSATITGLAAGTTYYVKVKAVGDGDAYTDSNESNPSSDVITINTAKDITAFTIAGVTATIGTNTVTATVASSTNLSSLTPTITITGASVSPASGAAQNFSSTVDYTVTAEDGTTKVYAVTISKAAVSTAAEITGFTITGQTGSTTISGTNISLTMPYGTDRTALQPSITLSLGATVNPASGVAADLSATKTYTVTAEDGTTQKAFSVSVTNAAPPAPTISLTSANSTQTLKAGSAITDLVFTLTNATGASFTGLPTGLSGVYNNGTYTISGTVDAGVTPGIFNYTVTATALSGYVGSAITSTGSLTVKSATAKNILYLATDATTTSNDLFLNDLRNNLNYMVTKRMSQASIGNYSSVDLIVLHESLNGSDASITNHELRLIKDVDKPILNLKSYFYSTAASGTSNRWNWGAPNNGNSGKGIKVVEPTHPIFANINFTDSIYLYGSFRAKNIQPTTITKGGFEIARVAGGVAIHDLPASARLASGSSKYLLVSMFNGAFNDLTANGLKLLDNAVNYLLSGAQFPTVTISGETKNASTLVTGSDVTVASNGILTADVTKTINNLVVESGGKVNSSTATLTVNNVVLKADFDTSPSVVVDHAMSISGTATLQKTLDNSKWYFISFPCDVPVNSIAKISGTGTLTSLGIGASSNWWIKYYNGATRAQNLGTSSNWVNVVAGETLTANQGYIIGLDNSLTGNYVLSFPLNNTLFTAAEVDRKVTVGTYGEGLVPANHVGWNLVGSPYLSRFSGSGVNANFLTFHNGSSYTQLQKGSVSGIEPFTAFFIQASSGTTGTLLDFALAGRQTVRSLVNTSTADNIKLSLQNGFNSDYTSLILDDAQSSSYQVGQDLEKWITTGTNQPQVYSILNGINFAYNALPISAVNNIPIGFYTKTAGNSTIHVDASQATGISQLLLKDNVTGATVDLLQTDYSFTATAGTTTNRLVLNARRVTTDKPEINNHEGEPQVLINNSKLLINNLTENATVRVYDMVGHLIYNQQPTSSSVEIPVKVAGVYSIQLQTGNRTWTQKVVVK